MLNNTMVVVAPVDNPDSQEGAIYLDVWARATELLRPKLGKLYTSFAPSVGAWKQTLRNPFGVVLGKTEPALFMYFYTVAKSAQKAAIEHHMAGLMEGISPVFQSETENMAMYVVDAGAKGGAADQHLMWHLSVVGGVPLPDCGVYFLAEKEVFVTQALDQKVLSDLSHYALCVVTLMQEVPDHA